MSDELEEFVDNIKERPIWMRILFMIAFAVAASMIIVPLIFVLSFAQALFVLITGQVNANLKYFSATLSLYVTQLFEFLTFLSDVKPFPFSDLLEVEDESLQETSAKKEDKASSTASVAKSAAKKKSVKKPAKKKVAKKSSRNTKTGTDTTETS